MTDKKYWVWLSLAMKPRAKTDALLSAFPNPEKLYHTSTADRIRQGVFNKHQLERLEAVTLGDAERVIRACDENGWQIVTPSDIIYPAGLRKISDMPLALYVDGDISCLRGKVIIGMVGTREPCCESMAIARRIGSDFAKAGAVVVSGGARGIDTASHEGALCGGGKTVCVLGCGFGASYLRGNLPLLKEIKETGAVVSEYPPFTEATKYTFPVRNRIISGMSHAVLVVEAGEKSGSLITATCADEQSRGVFAVPGSIVTSAYTGANKLLKKGALAATCARDVLESYAVIYPDRLNLDAIDTAPIEGEKKPEEKPIVRQVIKKDSSSLSPDAEAVYEIFGSEPLHIDEICIKSSLTMSRVISALMQLRMADYIEQDNNSNYILKL